MKNCTYSFFDELIYIKNLDPNNKDIREIKKYSYLLRGLCDNKYVKRR